MGLYSGGLIIGRICASEIWGAYFQEGLFIYLFFLGGWGGLLSEFYGICGKGFLVFFGEAYFRRDLASEGVLCFKMGWA